ncbi:MAG: M56 family metallopeptidase [Thermoanaerobaculia bacterium]|nr:M56 family metallopeptidase [Thermoanaerobaculia bacterium]
MDSAFLGARLALSYLVTYLFHSTLLLGGAWLLARILRDRGLALQELAWKFALLGGFVTAGLRVLTQALERPAAVPSSTFASLAPVSGEVFAGPHPGLTSFSGQLAGWERLLLVTWAVGAVVSLGLLARGWQRWRHCLASRRALESGALRESLDQLLERVGHRAPVGLAETPALPVPVAHGVFTPEICLPNRLAERLTEDARSAVLAHELGHVVRHDPAWLLLARGIESLCFLQPLNRLARVRLQSLSEYQADAWALEATGDRKGLAHCLVEVAGWLRPTPALLAPGMAGGRGPLSERVERILAGEAAASPRVRPWTRLGFLAVLGLTMVFGPALAPPALLGPAVADAAEVAPPPAESPAKPPAVAALEPAETADDLDEPGSEAIEAAIAQAVDEALTDGVEGGWEEDFHGALAGNFDEALAAGAFGVEALAGLEALGGLEALRGLEALGELKHLAPAIAATDETFAGAWATVAELGEEDRALPLSREEIELLEAQARQWAENHRQLSEADLERLRAAARELAEATRPSPAEIEKLRAEARALAERHRPGREQLDRLREEARALAERHRPSPEQFAEIQEHARALARDARHKARLERERLRQQSSEALAEELADHERRLEAELARIRMLRAEAERQRAAAEDDATAPEPPRP